MHVMSAHVQRHNGKPTLFIDGEPQLATQYALTDCPGGRYSWEEIPAWNIGLFAKSGFTQFQLDIWLDQMWTLGEGGEERFDIALARRQIAGVVAQCPNAAVFLRLHVNAPRWWNARHPDELVHYLNAELQEEDTFGAHRRPLIDDLKPVPRASFASRAWKEESGRRVTQLLRELAQTPEAAHLAGIQPACGVFGEWHQFAFFDCVGDDGPAMRRLFAQWLRAKYGDEGALQAAWGRSVGFEDDLIPTIAERERADDGIFRDPTAQRNVIDYYTCQHENLADTILYFCRLCKEAWPAPIVTGSFFGYFFSVFGLHGRGGHIAAYSRALRSPHIDYFSAPQSYDRLCRDQGGSGQSRGLIDSMALFDKLWLDEMDQLPSFDQLRIEDPPRTADVREDIWLYRRNVGYAYTHGVGQWYYDFGPTDTSGWWDHPDMQADIRALRDLFQRYHRRAYASCAQVLFVYDSEVFYHLGDDGAIDPITDAHLVNGMGAYAFRTGAVVDMVHLACWDRIDLRRYRCVVFANCFRLRAEQRDWIRARVLRDGRHAVFCCATGYTDGDRNDAAFIERATGFRVRRDACPPDPTVALEGNDMRYGVPLPWAPYFTPDDATAVIAGRLPDGRPALVYRDDENGRAWYSSVPIPSAEVLAHIFEAAGAHLYARGGDIVHAGGGLLVLHTARAGEKAIALRSGKTLRIAMSAGATILLDEETGKVLLPEACGPCRTGYFAPATVAKCRER